MNISKIMVVDDCDGDQFIAKIRIRDWDPNIEIIQVYDGREALEILSALDNQPDVILLDINMPGMDGHEFLAEYNKRDHQSIVVAMLTSSGHDKDREQATKYDFVKAYFMKTFDNSDIEFLKKL